MRQRHVKKEEIKTVIEFYKIFSRIPSGTTGPGWGSHGRLRVESRAIRAPATTGNPDGEQHEHLDGEGVAHVHVRFVPELPSACETRLGN